MRQSGHSADRRSLSAFSVMEALLSLGLKASASDTAGKKLLLMLRDDFLQRPMTV